MHYTLFLKKKTKQNKRRGVEVEKRNRWNKKNEMLIIFEGAWWVHRGVYIALAYLYILVISCNKNWEKKNVCWPHTIWLKVLRKWSEETSSLNEDTVPPALVFALPSWLSAPARTVISEASCQELSENGTPLSFAVVRGVKIRQC